MGEDGVGVAQRWVTLLLRKKSISGLRQNSLSENTFSSSTTVGGNEENSRQWCLQLLDHLRIEWYSTLLIPAADHDVMHSFCNILFSVQRSDVINYFGIIAVQESIVRLLLAVKMKMGLGQLEASVGRSASNPFSTMPHIIEYSYFPCSFCSFYSLFGEKSRLHLVMW